MILAPEPVHDSKNAEPQGFSVFLELFGAEGRRAKAEFRLHPGRTGQLAPTEF